MASERKSAPVKAASGDGEPLEGRRERKKREMRQRIFETGRRLFSANGFNETTVEEITAELDVSVPTFFNYFGSKDALLLEVAEEMVSRFEVLLEELGADEEASLDSIEVFVARIGDAFHDLPRPNRRLYVELLRVTLPHEAGRRIVSRIHDALTQMIRNGQARGEIRNDLDPNQIAQITADVLTGTFNNWLNDSALPLEQRIRGNLCFLQTALRPERHESSL